MMCNEAQWSQLAIEAYVVENESRASANTHDSPPVSLPLCVNSDYTDQWTTLYPTIRLVSPSSLEGHIDWSKTIETWIKETKSAR